MRSNIVALFGWQGIQYILPLISIPYLARVLGVDAFGVLAVATSFVAYATVVCEWGFALTATQQISAARNDPAQIRLIVWSTLLARAFLCIPAVIAAFTLAMAIPSLREHVLVFAVLMTQVIGTALTISWLLQGLEKMVRFTLASLVGRCASIVPMFFLVHGPDDLIIAAALQSAGVFITAAIALTFAPQRVVFGPVALDFNAVKRQIINGADIFASQAAAALYSQSNVIIVSLISGTTSAGYFSGADRIRRAAQGVLTPLSTALYPRVSLLAKTDPESAFRLVRKGFKAQLLLGLFVSLSLLFFAEPLVYILLGKDFIDAVGVVRVLSIVPLIVCFSNISGVLVMIPFGHKQYLSWIMLLAGAVNILVVGSLAAAIGPIGGALALVVAELLVSALMMSFVIRRYGLKTITGWNTGP